MKGFDIPPAMSLCTYPLWEVYTIYRHYFVYVSILLMYGEVFCGANSAY